VCGTYLGADATTHEFRGRLTYLGLAGRAPWHLAAGSNAGGVRVVTSQIRAEYPNAICPARAPGNVWQAMRTPCIAHRTPGFVFICTADSQELNKDFQIRVWPHRRSCTDEPCDRTKECVWRMMGYRRRHKRLARVVPLSAGTLQSDKRSWFRPEAGLRSSAFICGFNASN
jgi:hypothetical protein